MMTRPHLPLPRHCHQDHHSRSDEELLDAQAVMFDANGKLLRIWDLRA